VLERQRREPPADCEVAGGGAHVAAGQGQELAEQLVEGELAAVAGGGGQQVL
jgi:hypothetical protein